ncbi:SRPBCC family protein [Salsipaludibacter albus]|uniref:SRPBCC family protein n=1 Tax=Salsipaludibacter albus TaxID=2849650 RepID=UPI001EE4A7DD|nr:SRPBCC family protein [Salsipaludibacter albus]
MRLEVERHVAAPIDVVWGVLVDWERQSDWMLDAKRVEVVTPEREGHGVTIHVPTSLLGLPVLDVMRVTGWDPPHRLEATHLGRVIRGVGAFELSDEAGGTRLSWWEEVEAPLGALGEFGAGLALPVLRRIFSTSLRRLAALAEERAHGGPDAHA